MQVTEVPCSTAALTAFTSMLTADPDYEVVQEQVPPAALSEVWQAAHKFDFPEIKNRYAAAWAREAPAVLTMSVEDARQWMELAALADGAGASAISVVHRVLQCNFNFRTFELYSMISDVGTLEQILEGAPPALTVLLRICQQWPDRRGKSTPKCCCGVIFAAITLF